MKIGKLTTLARPYALAAFEYASEHQAVTVWHALLQNAADIVAKPEVQAILHNPAVSAKQLEQFFLDVLSSFSFNKEQENFIKLLLQNKRMGVLPEIAKLFTAYKDAEENVLKVRVVSAVELDQAYQERLVNGLTKRFGRQISLERDIDPSVLGGVMVYAGDEVIDGSVRGKLDRLVEFIL